MKKFYVSIVVCLCLVVSGYAQTLYWVGAASGGNWNSAANWGTNTAGPGGAGVPGSGANVIFDRNASLNLDISAITVNTLTITSSSTVRLTANAGAGAKTFQVNSTSTGTPGLLINAGSRLEHSCVAGSTFEFVFPANGKGEVNGQWYFTGANQDDVSTFTLPQTTSQTTKLNINSGGSIIVGDNAYVPSNSVTGDSYLSFKSGSTYEVAGNIASVPKADYDNNSTILITGLTTNGIILDEKADIGNLIYNCAGQTVEAQLKLINININGDLQILNTNNQVLQLMSNGAAGAATIVVVVGGDLEILGNSVVVLSNVGTLNKTLYFEVGDSLIVSGTSFDIQKSNLALTLPTTLNVKGHIKHTAGTLSASSSRISENADLFIIECSGSSAQRITSTPGSFDNTGHQVTLLMNNASGVTLLSPLEIGRINFNGGSHGVLTTSAGNELTINNTSGNARVINIPSNSGYVDGPVRRKTVTSGSSNLLVMPTGDGGVYRPVSINLSSVSGTTTYEATYFNAPHPSRTSVQYPIIGVSDQEYWEVHRVGAGSNAQLRMTLAGAITGATASHSIVVSKFNGSAWTNVKGTEGSSVVGTSTNGTVESETQSSFSFFTFGYGSTVALPTNLVSFTGKKASDRSAELNWKITDNSTPAEFDILRSADGVSFSSIGSVAGSDNNRSYSFTDAHLSSGTNYYRLRMLDRDGSVTMSNIIVVTNGIQGVIISSVMPTIVSDRARIAVSSSLNGRLQLVITDTHGRIVQQQVAAIAAGSQDIFIQASRLAGGMYQVTGYMNGEKTASLRFIKQ